MIDKEAGLTSHDVVARVRGLAGQRKVGHGGTLDPMATGLLVLGLGRTTRLLRFVQELPKEYLARVVFGVATDTLDAEGSVVWREPMPFGEEDLRRALGGFLGTVTQVPPMVSAVRVGGRHLYELARGGEEVERAARPAEVYELELCDFAPGDHPEATLRVRCGKGTYVRVLADDIARALGGRAHLSKLRRTALGSFQVQVVAWRLGDLQNRVGELPTLSPAEGLRDLPAIRVDPELTGAVSHGKSLPATKEGPGEGQPLRVLDQEGNLLGVYRREGAQLLPTVVLA